MLERLLEPWPELEAEQPPTLAVMAEVLARSGVPFKLAAAGPSRNYEESVVLGQIPTREASWHDTFNVLAFALYPASKTALHARCRALAIDRQRVLPRSREEDALTLIDEVSVVVAGSSEGIEEFERARPAKIVSRLDAIVREHALFVDVLGHGLLEHLMLGRPGVGAGVVTVVLSGEVSRERVDVSLAGRIVAGGFPKPGLSPTLPWPHSGVDAWFAAI